MLGHCITRTELLRSKDSRLQRVQKLEGMVLEQIRWNWGWLRDKARVLGMRWVPLLEATSLGLDALAGVPFVRDGRALGRSDGSVYAGVELVRRPAMTWAEGGDCEDRNLVLLGGLLAQNVNVLRAQWQEGAGYPRPPVFLGGYYTPSIAEARHVELYVSTAGAAWILDGTPNGQRFRAAEELGAKGQLVTWND